MSEKSQKQQTLLSGALDAYQKKYNIKQQPLADYLNVDVRTLRRWISGETILTDIRELRGIARMLGIEPECLGVALSPHIQLLPEQINEKSTYDFS